MRNNEEIISLIKSYLDNSSMSMSELATKAEFQNRLYQDIFLAAGCSH